MTSARCWFGWILVAACAPPEAPSGDGPIARFDPDGGFWDAPLPAEHRREGGVVDLGGLDDGGVPLVADLIGLLHGVDDGFGRSSPVWLPFDRSLVGAALPSVADTLTAASPVWLIDVDPESPERGRRWPVEVAVSPGGGPWDGEHVLGLLPVQGVPLRAGTRYAAVVRTTLRDGRGEAFRTGDALAAAMDGAFGDAAAWAAALDVLAGVGVGRDDVAAMTVFTTSTASTALPRHLATLADAGGLTLLSPFTLVRAEPAYCAFEARVDVPVLQTGTPPYLSDGGGFADDGEVQGREQARMFVTVPRGRGGLLPAVTFARTGGGGDLPLLDRGVRAEPGVDVPGTGYAAEFAAAGWAGVQLDGVLGGLRNPGGDEQFLIFNVGNPVAMRDNLRQSALELALLPELLDDVELDGDACAPGTGPVRVAAQALWGHSMGATIAPLTLAIQPRYDTLLLSGAGGSWIHNVLYKRSPLAVAPIAAALLGQTVDDLHRWHVALGLLQWAGEPADPPVVASGALELAGRGGVHVLMVQGIVDTYILPPIANATSAALGLDLGGPALDVAALPELEGASSTLALVGRGAVDLPAQGNVDGWTRVVVQRSEDGVEDGHEAAYQDPWARAAVERFLETRLDGVPIVGP